MQVKISHLSLLFGMMGGLACAPVQEKSSQPSIYGGVASAPGAWLGAVALTNTLSRGQEWCSGTAVTPSLIITAAHCLKISSASERKIYVGDGFEENATGRHLGEFAEYEVESYRVHPLYGTAGGFDQAFDIGYLVLKQPLRIPASEIVPILRDPKEISEALQVGGKATIVGFGTKPNGDSGSKFEAVVDIRRVGSREITMGGGGIDSCYGDSGGPAYARLADGSWRVFGIVSRGPDCGSGGEWGLMHPYLCWIQKDSGQNWFGLSDDDCIGESPYVQACEQSTLNPASPASLTVKALQKQLLAGLSCADQYRRLSKRTDLYLTGEAQLDGAILGELTAVKRLTINGAQIANSEKLGRLKALESLNLRASQTDSLVFLQQLSQLTKLDLSQTHLQSVTALAGLVQLRELFLLFNDISDVKALEGLVNLETLNLSNNRLQAVDDLRSLQNLHNLSLNSNLITSLSPIKDLPALVQFSASNNLIVATPLQCPIEDAVAPIRDFCRAWLQN